MKILRGIFKWGLRGVLLIAAVLFVCWGVVRVSRAHYRGLALQAPAAFIVENAPVIALTHARVIDGNGTPALERSDFDFARGDDRGLWSGGRDCGAAGGARVESFGEDDACPGLVMMHEHLVYCGAEFRQEVAGRGAAMCRFR